MKERLQNTIDAIEPISASAAQAARDRQSQLTKPLGSLGRLEELSIRIAGIMDTPCPSVRHKVIITMAGDHGVAADGVSAYPQEVTPQMVLNMLAGGAAINVLAKHIGARVLVVDMGVASDMGEQPALINRRVAPGTSNIARGPAMTREQAIESIVAGIDIVENELAQGLDIVGTGDMGIANTTPSAAICAAMTGHAPAEIAGRGTGVDDEGLRRKLAAIESALRVNQPDPADALDVLAKVGGYEIGGIAGVVLGAAAHRRPVVVDGFISTAGAMLAAALAPHARDYMIGAHVSQETGHRLMLEWLGLDPLLDMGMRLGEGTGAALAMSLAEAACRVLNEMATFAEAGVSEKEEA